MDRHSKLPAIFRHFHTTFRMTLESDAGTFRSASSRTKRGPPPKPFEMLLTSVDSFISQHSPEIKREPLLATLPRRWSHYPPLILLPQTSFSTSEWQEYLSSLPEDLRNLLYSQIASSLKATHLALNAPIQDDTIRSPLITPLCGDFGPLVPGIPGGKDFEEAFWVQAVQNGIKQTWAPRYTMFSRGNITEKARILHFPDVKDQEVADLFVGIGYFAFSYLKAGAKRVWGWDLNPWSVEGLRRGAELNGWKCAVNPEKAEEERVVVYNEDNARAIEMLKMNNVKVKHVNLGLLPSSECAWGIATQILHDEGGWIHVHGNCKDTEIDGWIKDVENGFRILFGQSWMVDCQERFRVKEYGPAVGHWILDLYCSRISNYS